MYSASRLGALVTREASIDTIDAALDLDARTVEESGSGDLLTRVTDDLSSASNAVSFDLLEILFVVLYFVVSMASLATLSIPMSLIFLPMIVGLAVLMRHYLPRMAQKNQVVQENTSELNSVLTENVRGAATIRELGVHSSREKVFDDGNRHRFEATLQMQRLRQRFYVLDALNAWFPTIVCLLWGSFCVMQGWASWGAVATASIMVFSLRVMADILGHHTNNIRLMLVNMGRYYPKQMPGLLSTAAAFRAAPEVVQPLREQCQLYVQTMPQAAGNLTCGNARVQNDLCVCGAIPTSAQADRCPACGGSGGGRC